jgi:hypothetical protein
MYPIPILYLVFNRPKETQQSFEVIRRMKPAKLYVAADGPRTKNQADIINSKKVRDLIEQSIDWDCEVNTLYRDANLGCGKAVQGALDWFFSEVEMGIIIEDDIIPDLSFFEYCKMMLHQYKENQNVFSINGCSLAYKNFNADFGATKFFNMWGWATWRRSNELVKKTWPAYNKAIDFKKGSDFLKTLHLPTIYPQTKWNYRWEYIFESTKAGKIDTWDYQWVYTCLKNKQYCIRPNLNMINNIGFTDNSTHTSQAPHPKLSNMRVHNLSVKNGNLKGSLTIDSQYELENVAEYWNNIRFNYKIFKNHLFAFIKVKMKKVIGSKYKLTFKL